MTEKLDAVWVEMIHQIDPNLNPDRVVATITSGSMTLRDEEGGTTFVTFDPDLIRAMQAFWELREYLNA